MASESKLHSERKLVTDGNTNLFQEDLLKLVNNADYSDVKFIVGESKTVIYGHKCLLAVRSEQFKCMFHSSSDDGFSIPDMSPDVFLLILQFIYTNSCMVLQLLSAALEYSLKDLVTVCEKYIIEKISINNVCHAIQTAVTFGLDDFKRNLLSFIEEHAQEVFSTESFNEISDVTLAYILQSDELNIDEIDIVKAVKGWAVINSLATNKPLYEVSRLVVCNLRLPLFSPDQLTQVEAENLKERYIPVEQISVAWKHRALKTPRNSSLETAPRREAIKRCALLR